jgi:hypothetical protein
MKVSGKDDIPNMYIIYIYVYICMYTYIYIYEMENQINVWNHQPFIKYTIHPGIIGVTGKLYKTNILYRH